MTPESATGGLPAHVCDGDRIRLSVAKRAISVPISDEALATRIREQPVVAPTAPRGDRKPFWQTVMQADRGPDFDFPRAARTMGKTLPG